ncbi:hypothetical protein [Pelomonas sp. KK5]|uniref:hypothetical protein n=1 Tax=Pelomonas sp. KK5 TaxID=1855730 RepID=UPI00097BEBF9|nr:hypothetical protein [Pelomonas sp. KK5]
MMAMLAGGIVAGALAAGAAAWWLWGRRLAASLERVAKLEQNRQVSDQFASQARRQIGQLQAEMAELRQQAARSRSSRSKTAPVHAEQDDLLLREVQRPSPAEPFPATQILPRSRP